MLFPVQGLRLAATLGLFYITNAQSDVSSPSRKATGTVHKVAVGKNGMRFEPDTIEASVGDTIQFEFYPGGHSVVQAGFEYPCIPYQWVPGGIEGFSSGIMPAESLTDPLLFDWEVKDSEPQFFYCGAPGSCLENHMVGVINPNSTFTLDEQKKAIARYPHVVSSPSDPWPPNLPKPGSTETPSPTGVLSIGAIVGVALGGAAAAVLVATLLYLCGRRGGFKKGYRRSDSHALAAAAAAPLHQVVEANYPDAPRTPADSVVSPFSQNATTQQPWSGRHVSVPHRSSASPSVAQSLRAPGEAEPAAGSYRVELQPQPVFELAGGRDIS
ncbi:hypothetical protein F4780DRAFT_777117 [Xylariomycetidae sp. FL0641]|nr:hypothetical protein F4780DRAFT_777117 [Xylariomycetidae sp. FL0641]